MTGGLGTDYIPRFLRGYATNTWMRSPLSTWRFLPRFLHRVRQFTT